MPFEKCTSPEFCARFLPFAPASPDLLSTLPGAMGDLPEWPHNGPLPSSFELVLANGDPGGDESREESIFPLNPTVLVLAESQPSLFLFSWPLLFNSPSGFWAFSLRRGKSFLVTRAGINFTFLCGFLSTFINRPFVKCCSNILISKYSNHVFCWNLETNINLT